MSATEVAVEEVDETRMHMVFDDLAEGTGPLGAELANLDPAELAGQLGPRQSRAYRKAVALLCIYLSRADFLRHQEIDSDSEKVLYRFKNRPLPRGRGQSAIR